MSSKPKLLFVYDHPNPAWWLDGLSAALDVLEEDFDICRYNLGTDNEKEIGDFILGWGAFGSGVDRYIQANLSQYDKKTGLCIAGNATPPDGANNYDVLFYETKWYRPTIGFHSNIHHAFGINSDLFSPSPIAHSIVFDYLGVGALAAWKRWDKMVDKRGVKMVVGEYQVDNVEESLGITDNLLRNGVGVMPQVHPLELAMLYHSARTVYMPSDVYGGGERTVLEARACGCNVEIEDDNPKLKELTELDTIPTHIDYAKALKKGIMSVL